MTTARNGNEPDEEPTWNPGGAGSTPDDPPAIDDPAWNPGGAGNAPNERPAADDPAWNPGGAGDVPQNLPSMQQPAWNPGGAGYAYVPEGAEDTMAGRDRPTGAFA